MPVNLLKFAIQNKLVDFHQNRCQTNQHVYIKGWKQTCFKCYWIKKQIEPFRIHPLVFTTQYHKTTWFEKNLIKAADDISFSNQKRLRHKASVRLNMLVLPLSLYTAMYFIDFFWQQTYTEINQSHPLSPKSSNCCTLHHLDNVQTYQTSKDMYIYNVNCFGFWYICTSVLLIMSLYLLNH